MGCLQQIPPVRAQRLQRRGDGNIVRASSDRRKQGNRPSRCNRTDTYGFIEIVASCPYSSKPDGVPVLKGEVDMSLCLTQYLVYLGLRDNPVFGLPRVQGTMRRQKKDGNNSQRNE